MGEKTGEVSVQSRTVLLSAEPLLSLSAPIITVFVSVFVRGSGEQAALYIMNGTGVLRGVELVLSCCRPL